MTEISSELNGYLSKNKIPIPKGVKITNLVLLESPEPRIFLSKDTGYETNSVCRLMTIDYGNHKACDVYGYCGGGWRMWFACFSY